jgi:hypothetical protein
MRIAVIDGQGGGVGRSLITELHARLDSGHAILALGANAVATSAMLKAGADEGATGENAVIYNAGRVDVIAGPIGIILANALLGEVTPNMARAVAESSAMKVLIPMEKCQVHVVGAASHSMQQSVEQAVSFICSLVDAAANHGDKS